MENVDSERLSKAIEDIKRQCDYAESAKEPEDEVSWDYETGILISRKDAENILQALANGIDEKIRREASASMRLVSDSRRWINVEERLPEPELRANNSEFVFVLVSHPNEGVMETMYCNGKFEHPLLHDIEIKADDCQEKWNNEITHWMPLPKPPE